MKYTPITTIAAAVMLLFGGITEVNGDPLTYEVVGDTVTIKDCKETASGALAIPLTYDGKPVTRIGEDAFNGCSSLTSVTIERLDLTSIPWGAFAGCSSLTGVTIPDSVTSIGHLAFAGCSSLASVTIPDSVTHLAWAAFEGCSGLTSVTIPDSVTSIGNNAFAGCSSLTSVTIGNSVTRIGEYAFYGCSSLTSVTIPDSVTRIGLWAFRRCSSLTSVTISGSVTYIGEYAFSGCTSLTSVTIPDSVISIYNGAFEGCTSLKRITFGGDASKLYGAKVFSKVSDNAKVFINPDAIGFGETYGGLPVVYKTVLPTDHLTYKVSGNTVTITDCKETVSGALAIPLTYDGKPVTSIGNMAFKNCSSLTSVIIGNNVTSIGNWAFEGCHSLTNVTIPDSVTRIGNNAFAGCSSLKSITFEGNAPSSLGADVFKYLPIGATITVPVGATGFGETFGGLPVIIEGKLEINTFSQSASPFSLNFESRSASTYIIEASHDLKKWGEIGKVQAAGSSVEFTDWREALFQKQYYRLKLVE